MSARKEKLGNILSNNMSSKPHLRKANRNVETSMPSQTRKKKLGKNSVKKKEATSNTRCCRMLQRYPTDKAYYIAKELLMTERTYKKDLEVVDLVRRTRRPFVTDVDVLFSS